MQSIIHYPDYKALVKSVVILDDGVADSSDVVVINGYAFSSCTNLTSVTIPETVMEIGDGAFATCTSLKSVALPNSLQSIGSGAFFGSGLTSVTLPASVTTLKGNAFGLCESLINVIFQGNTPPSTVGATVFDTTTLNGIYVPTAFVDTYKAALTAYASLISAKTVAITKNSTTTYYPTLTAALAVAADGDTVTLLANITESVSYTVSAGKVITINGCGLTLTASSNVALTLTGTGTVILKDLTLQSNASSGTSTGLDVSGSVSVQSYGTVTANGSAAKATSSYGVINSGTGTVDVTEAVAAGTQSGIGAYNTGSGTINVGTATGSGAMIGEGAYNDAGGTINVTTARGTATGVKNISGGTINVTTAIITGTNAYYSCAVNNMGTGTVNVTTATNTNTNINGNYAVINKGTVNAGTITGSTDNSGSGKINTGAAVMSVPLHAGTGASCVLDSITIANSGSTIGTLPDVYKGGACSAMWYTGADLTNLFSMQEISPEATLYSSYYTPDVTLNTAAISGVTAPVRGAAPVTSLSETSEYTAAIAWSPTVSGAFAAGTVYTATITLTPKTGYTTTGVAANFFTVAGASATNSADSGIITAVFPSTASASSNDGSSSSGGGTTTTPTTTMSGSTATTTVTPTISGGAATGSATADQMSDALKKAQVAAGTGGTPNVTIQVSGASGVSSVGTTIPHASMQALVSGGVGTLTILGPTGSVSFDAAALKTLSGASGDVTITIAKADSSTLSDAARAHIGSHPVFTFSVTSGGSAVSRFGGDVTVSVPYTPASGEDTNAIVIYYIAADGTPTLVQDARYDAATGTVIFTTTHFSIYAVGYNKVSFTDVASGAWYTDAVTFLAARGITSGTTATTFGHDATLTRGQFITMLLRAYGVASVTNPADNFTDAGSTYYTGYLAAAKKLGITSGVGDNNFAPDNAITRQEMFTLLYNALKVLDKLPSGASGKTLSSFTDSGSIASWATDAMMVLVKAGTVTGSNGTLNPTGNTTRAEMAQVLYNLLGK